jgi:hypothetical protein
VLKKERYLATAVTNVDFRSLLSIIFTICDLIPLICSFSSSSFDN